MSKKEPKSAKNMSAPRRRLRISFTLSLRGTPKSTPKARRNRGRKALNPYPSGAIVNSRPAPASLRRVCDSQCTRTLRETRAQFD